MKAKKETRSERVERERHEKKLRKQKKHIKGHLKYLHTISADPDSAAAEIRRHERHIAKLLAKVEEHAAHIEHIKDMVAHAPEMIETVQNTLRSVERNLNANLIEKLKQEYLSINKMLREERDVSSREEE